MPLTTHFNFQPGLMFKDHRMRFKTRGRGGGSKSLLGVALIFGLLFVYFKNCIDPTDVTAFMLDLKDHDRISGSGIDLNTLDETTKRLQRESAERKRLRQELMKMRDKGHGGN